MNIFNKNTYMKFVLTIMLVLIVVTDINAQIGLPGDGDVNDVPEAFIDGFIGLALIIGSYFGIKKIRK